MILWGATTNGPTALPGLYQVRLTVDGQSQTQPLTIRKHPLRNTPDADLQEQFALGLQIRDKVSVANNAVIEIRRIIQVKAIQEIAAIHRYRGLQLRYDSVVCVTFRGNAWRMEYLLTRRVHRLLHSLQVEMNTRGEVTAKHITFDDDVIQIW